MKPAEYDRRDTTRTFWCITPPPHTTAPKLTMQDADDIRQAHAAGEGSMAQLARWYGISKTAVHKIIHDETYRDTTEEAA